LLHADFDIVAHWPSKVRIVVRVAGTTYYAS
jgi:hypothetical protein